MSEDHGSDRESSMFTTRPGGLPFFNFEKIFIYWCLVKLLLGFVTAARTSGGCIELDRIDRLIRRTNCDGDMLRDILELWICILWYQVNRWSQIWTPDKTLCFYFVQQIWQRSDTTKHWLPRNCSLWIYSYDIFFKTHQIFFSLLQQNYCVFSFAKVIYDVRDGISLKRQSVLFYQFSKMGIGTNLLQNKKVINNI